jgi:hypothetical protein
MLTASFIAFTGITFIFAMVDLVFGNPDRRVKLTFARGYLAASVAWFVSTVFF